MAQHFLLSAKAKTLSIAKLALMSEKECERYFRALRWASNEASLCVINVAV